MFTKFKNVGLVDYLCTKLLKSIQIIHVGKSRLPIFRNLMWMLIKLLVEKEKL